MAEPGGEYTPAVLADLEAMVRAGLEPLGHGPRAATITPAQRLGERDLAARRPGRRAAGSCCGCTASATTSPTRSAPSSPGSRRCATRRWSPRPSRLPARDGELVQTLPRPSGRPARQAVAFAFEDGRSPSRATTCRAGSRPWARITGRMHAHSRRWPQPAGLPPQALGLRRDAGRAARSGAAGRTGWASTRPAARHLGRVADAPAPAARRLRPGAGPVRPDPRRPAARQPPGRRRPARRDRLRRLRPLLVRLRLRRRGELLRARSDRAGAWPRPGSRGYREQRPLRAPRTRRRCRCSSCCAGCCSPPGSRATPRRRWRRRWALAYTQGTLALGEDFLARHA